MSQTTVDQFTPSGKVATTETGKNIYISDIGNYHLRFISKRGFEWRIYDNSGNYIKSLFAITGNIQPAINNSYYSETFNKVFVEFNVGNQLYKAEFNKENFDLSPLESLPSVKERIDSAQNKSDSANEADRLNNTSFINQLFNSIFGTDIKNIPLILGGVLVGIFLLNRMGKK